MRNQLRNIFNSKVSEISILLIICALIVTNLSTRNHNGWTDIAVIASIAGGLILLFLLVWGTSLLFAPRIGVELLYHIRLMAQLNICRKGYNNISFTLGFVLGGRPKRHN